MKAVLRYRYTPGQVLRYRASTRVAQQNDDESSQGQHEWDAVLCQEVVAVDGDGSAHVIARAALEDVDPMGTEAALEAQRTVTYNKVDTRGRVILTSGPVPTAAWTLPVCEVDVGHRWSEAAVYPLPPSGQPAPVPFYYRYDRDEEAAGRICAVIEMNAATSEWEVALPETGEPAFVSATIHGSLWFDPADGLLVRSEVATVATPRVAFQSVVTETTMVQELERVEVRAC